MNDMKAKGEKPSLPLVKSIFKNIVAKKEIKNIPGIGNISDAAQNLHLDRSSKDDKSGILK